MIVKYITVKGPDRLAREPFYMGILQHDRTLSRREFYDLDAGRTGYKPSAAVYRVGMGTGLGWLQGGTCAHLSCTGRFGTIWGNGK